MAHKGSMDDLHKYNNDLNRSIGYFAKMWGGYLLTLKLKECSVYCQRLKGLLFARFANSFPNDITSKRIAVYTVLYGKYDNIKPIKARNDCMDYFAFTDQSVPIESGWIKRDFPFPEDIQNDNVLKSRYLRMHPHLLFPDYDYSIYVDASFIIQHDLFRLFSRMGNSNIGMFRHPWAKDIYDEAELVIHWKRAPEEITLAQINRYQKEGYPKGFGMTTTGVIVSKCNNDDVIRLMEAWWNEFRKPENTKRDQMCLYYVIWKLNNKKDSIKFLGTRVYDDPIIEQHSWYNDESRKK